MAVHMPKPGLPELGFMFSQSENEIFWMAAALSRAIWPVRQTVVYLSDINRMRKGPFWHRSPVATKNPASTVTAKRDSLAVMPIEICHEVERRIVENGFDPTS
jgi:hypothetical protein